MAGSKLSQGGEDKLRDFFQGLHTTLPLLHDVMEVAAGRRQQNVTDSTSQLICYTLKKNKEGKQQTRLTGAEEQMEITSRV